MTDVAARDMTAAVLANDVVGGFPVASHLAFFVENRNGVRIAATLVRELDPTTQVALITADSTGTVASWVTEEWAMHPGLPVIENVLDGLPRIEPADLGPAMVRELSEWISSRGVERVVLFNDQSLRGRWVVQAAHPHAGVVLIQDGTLEFETRVTTLGRQDQNWYYGTSGVDRVCLWGNRGHQNLLDRLDDGSVAPDVRVTGSVMHSADEQLAGAFEHKESLRRRGEPREPLDIVILDQPLAGQRKTTRSAHQAALRALVESGPGADRVSIKAAPFL